VVVSHLLKDHAEVLALAPPRTIASETINPTAALHSGEWRETTGFGSRYDVLFVMSNAVENEMFRAAFWQ
jgi:hypothetical protein